MTPRAPSGGIPPDSLLPCEGGSPVLLRAWRGEGSYARVYQGTRIGAPCAVKLAKAEIPEAADRLRAEREVLAAVRHPRIVALLDRGDYHGIPFLVLEWLEGGTLLELVQSRRRLPLRQSLEFLEAVCDGVVALHGHGRIHGDIRAQNVLVIGGRGAVVTDPQGTPPPDVPAAAGDVRALGRLLHQMLTGDEPGPAGTRLTTAEGYNKGAVRLWEWTQAADAPSAGAVLAEIWRLRASL
ncbi:MAG TPA: protein kinase [Armatimonadota bacterium]|nr:protein kinase [Armatimonadota bacterium]